MSSYPAPPPPDNHGQNNYGQNNYGQNTTAEPPPAIKTSVNIIWAVVALSVVGTILTFLFLDDIVESAGVSLDSSEADAARIGGMVGSVIGLLIFGALWVLLGIFLRKGANWARITLTVLAVLALVFGVIGLLGEQPAIFLVLGILQMALYVALLVFMWRKESSAYIAAQKAG